MTYIRNNDPFVDRTKRRIICRFLLLFIVSMFFVHGSFAQSSDPFAQKKGRKPDTDIEKRLSPFYFPNRSGNSTKRTGAGTSKSVNFQLNRPLTRDFDNNSYKHELVKKDDTGLPVFISSVSKKQSASRTTALDAKTASLAYLSEIGTLLKVDKPDQEFQIRNIHTDQLGQTHVKMQQVYKGVKVYGKEVVVHLRGNAVALFNGRNIPTPANMDTEAELNREDATSIAMADVSSFASVAKTNEKLKKLLNHSEHSHEPELVIYKHPGNGEVNLVWHVTVLPNILERWEYFIDAHDGSIVNKYNHTCSIDGPGVGNANDLNGVSRQINTYISSDVHYLIDASREMFNEPESSFPDNGIGVIMTLDLRNEPLTEGTSFYHVTSADNTWIDASAVSAHYNAEVAYEYFRTTFGRNSINGSGGNIYSIVNVADDDGTGLDNAFWNGTAMFYGNGNVGFTPLAGSLDVGGHEMSHGVIGATANLEYQYQSGAINESFADIFGVMIDRDDWLLGEDVVTNLFSSGALRSMEDPHNGGSGLGDRGYQPKHMSEIYTGSQDNGGVHINSGICNHAFFLFTSEVGKDIAEQIYYRALTVYLTASSQFIDLRLAVIQSATDLHGESSVEVQAAKDAFDAVGVFDGEPTDTDPELPVLEGPDLVLFYDLIEGEPATLYIYDVANDGYQDITTTEVFRKPTVTDDGSLAFFIDVDNTMQAIELTAPYQEVEVSPDPVWSNIAISKDGKRIAAISIEEDGSIHVIDESKEEAAIFPLYNPTTAEGVQTAEVLYADAIEWDYTGQYLMYDALNVIRNNTGDDIEYWDVGFIKVWDNVTNDYADGSIQKLFTSLPDGVSIGNPSFAKNSPNVVAFDMVDANDDEYYVLAANIETGDLQTVYNNSKIGFPGYSRLDNAMIFDAFDGTNDVIAVAGLEADKITPQGDPAVFIDQAKWGVWFTQAERVVLSSEKEMLSYDFVNLEDLTEVSITDSQINIKVPEEINVNSLVATFSHSSKATVQVGDLKQISGVTKNDFTNPVVYTVFAEDGSSKNYTVSVTKEETVTGMDSSDNIDINLYPNPATDKITMVFEKERPGKAEVVVLDVFGRVVTGFQVDGLTQGENKVELSLSGLVPGTYLVELNTEDSVLVSRVVKN